MEKRRLGNSELYTSVIGFGAWAAGKTGWGEVDNNEIVRTIQKAYDAGVNFFDTAPFYGYGESEIVLGKALKHVRQDVIIATKFGLKWDEKGNIIKDTSKQNVIREVEESLTRLGTEYIDLYQVHWPDENTPIEETMEALRSLQESGKIRYVGVSNFSVEQMEETQKYINIVSLQSLYNLLQRDIEKRELPYVKKAGIGFIPYSPLAQGLLTGKFNNGMQIANDDVRMQFNPLFQTEMFQQSVQKVRELEKIAKSLHKPLNQVAINWLLTKEEISTVIVGAKTVQQVEENIAASNWVLSAEDAKKIDLIFAE
jgi:aryl-alcohol dehydrogenase-like predicted oxidoreductase